VYSKWPLIVVVNVVTESMGEKGLDKAYNEKKECLPVQDREIGDLSYWDLCRGVKRKKPILPRLKKVYVLPRLSSRL